MAASDERRTSNDPRRMKRRQNGGDSKETTRCGRRIGRKLGGTGEGAVKVSNGGAWAGLCWAVTKPADYSERWWLFTVCDRCNWWAQRASQGRRSRSRSASADCSAVQCQLQLGPGSLGALPALTCHAGPATPTIELRPSRTLRPWSDRSL